MVFSLGNRGQTANTSGKCPSQRNKSLRSDGIEVDLKPAYEADKELLPFRNTPFVGDYGCVDVEQCQSPGVVVRVAVTFGCGHHDVGVGVGVDREIVSVCASRRSDSFELSPDRSEHRGPR